MKSKIFSFAALSLSVLLMGTSCIQQEASSGQQQQNVEVKTIKASLKNPHTMKLASAASVENGKKVFESKGCIACHSVDGSPRVGPSLMGIYGRKVTLDNNKTVTATEDYIRRAIKDPNAEIVQGFQRGMMVVASPPSDSEMNDLIAYFKSLKDSDTIHSGVQEAMGPPQITPEEMRKASDIFFNRCAGCHGVLRKGATGPALLPERTMKLGTEGIKNVVTYGLPGGMPPWGKAGILSKDEVNLLAKFLQHDPPAPPEMSLADMKNTWKEIVPLNRRPSRPEHNRNWKNFFGVVLRDAGQVAIFDGDTKEKISTVNTGFAVHILRTSASGRYIYSIGRDGKVTMIDLWMRTPQVVAEVKACFDARSVDASKYHGPKGDFRDQYLIVGGYWPPSIIIFNGQTLEPLKIVSTSGYTYDTNEYLREARAAAIVASHHDPEWVVNIKETGQMWLVDYQDIDNLKITAIEAERFLHDGGWDSTKRYVLMAANARDTISVVDTKTKKLIKNVKVGVKPHPGRGANIKHPKYGDIWCTGHLGDNTVACIGTDPVNKPQYAWKVVKSFELSGAGGGNLFIKTHPNSNHLWADRTLNPDTKLSRSFDIIDTNKLEVVRSIEIPSEFPGKAVHFEYNDKGDEVWISAWAGQGKPSAVLIYDDKTLRLKKEITGDWLVTPTGKFNVSNTMGDVY